MSAFQVLQEQINAIAARLTPDEKDALQRIYAPTVVGVHPQDTRCGLCVMPDGEIRHYGFRDKTFNKDDTHPVYLSSKDGGLSWKMVESDNSLTASGTRLSNGRYLALMNPGLNETGFSLRARGINDGFYAVLFDAPGSSEYELIQIDTPGYGIYDMFLPLELSTGRVVCAAQTVIDHYHHPVFLFSDDFGKSWQVRILPSCPRHVPVWPHKGPRWQNEGSEPTVVELNDGRLYMLIRTSQDYYYQSYSTDGGETWSTPEPSPLHGTLTSPQLLKLHDGRIICFYCNTQPLPELDHTQQFPPLFEGEINGLDGEDVFTNRDANHAVITEDDGAHWLGFREVTLNGIRNNADYRTIGGHEESYDKSVHQFQAIELPFGKILACYGQNKIARRMVIFDVNWLYEKERREDFRRGLCNVSTHVYLKSIHGNFRIAGHCSWNRTNGAVLMPDPDGNFEEALFLSRIPDPRLFSQTQGVVWNFPAARKGIVNVRLRVEGGPLHLSICDRWFNPIDDTVPHFALASFALTNTMLPAGTFTDVTFTWDTDTQTAKLMMGDVVLGTAVIGDGFPYGASYFIAQSAFDGIDTAGSYVKSMEMKTV